MKRQKSTTEESTSTITNSTKSSKKLFNKPWNQRISASRLLVAAKSLKYPRITTIPKAELFEIHLPEIENNKDLQPLVIRRRDKSFLAVDFNNPSNIRFIPTKDVPKSLDWAVFATAYLSKDLIFIMSYDNDIRKRIWNILRFSTKNGGFIKNTEVLLSSRFFNLNEAISLKLGHSGAYQGVRGPADLIYDRGDSSGEVQRRSGPI